MVCPRNPCRHRHRGGKHHRGCFQRGVRIWQGPEGRAHGVVQGGISEMQGGNFMHGFASGAIGSFGSAYLGNLGIGPAGHGISGALSGGFGSTISGGSFWHGAIQGGIVGLFNDGEHPLLGSPENPVMLDEVVVRGFRTAKAMVGGLAGLPAPANGGDLANPFLEPKIDTRYVEGMPIEMRSKNYILVVSKESNLYISVGNQKLKEKYNLLVYKNIKGPKNYNRLSKKDVYGISSLMRVLSDPLPNPLEWRNIYNSHHQKLEYNELINRLYRFRNKGLIY